MPKVISEKEVVGLIRPDIDVHTLGVAMVANLIKECGYKVVDANAQLAKAVATINERDHFGALHKWIIENKVTRLGFSYRLDPKDAVSNFEAVYRLLNKNGLTAESGGQIIQLYFAGLPEACEAIEAKHKDEVPVFKGDETPLETLLKIGVPRRGIPEIIIEGSKYDDERLAFAQKLISKGDYKKVKPLPRPKYKEYGTFKDTLPERVHYNRKRGTIPLMRAHVGPYNPDYRLAKDEFNEWMRDLANSKMLDIVSIGSSQLSQSDFGTEWGTKPNGGGVPINSEQDLRDIWDASRPMLVRAYSATRNIPEIARIYDRTINIAWYALSFWWFNQIDGRGPYTVKEGLRQHIETLKVIAELNRPFEPNIPHHFAFRGGDDCTYVLSAYLAAKTAKKIGIKNFVLQTMLNTPKYTWGIQDLAKARSLLRLVRELEDDSFTVYLQPRAGLDYFSPDFEKAKVQLSAVTAMMDDIEPENEHSPDIIHIVSYCEAITLATPVFINESIQIAIHTLNEYRDAKKRGLVNDMRNNVEVEERTNVLYKEVKRIIEIIETNIDDPYTPEGLYEIFRQGVFATPYLWEGREEFKNAVQWQTSFIDGGIQVVDKSGNPIKPSDRVARIFSEQGKYA